MLPLWASMVSSKVNFTPLEVIPSTGAGCTLMTHECCICAVRISVCFPHSSVYCLHPFFCINFLAPMTQIRPMTFCNPPHLRNVLRIRLPSTAHSSKVCPVCFMKVLSFITDLCITHCTFCHSRGFRLFSLNPFLFPLPLFVFHK